MNKEGGAFCQDDLRLLSSLAGSAAAAIANARLYEQAQQEITERKRVEAALEAERSSLAQRVADRTAELRKANAELAQAARLKDRFVTNVSHELRTPLSVLTLLSGNLDMLYDRLDDDRRRKMVKDIREYGRVLRDLIDNVLEISRIDNQRLSQEVGRVDLGHLTEEEAAKQLPLAEKKSQTLHVTGERGLEVEGNEGQLRQVIRNLLNNAIKYTPEGGTITCEYRAHAGNGHLVGEWPGAKGLAPGAWAALRVADTGIGINQEDLPHLFERFYRVETQGSIPGVGLGLSIAKELVELHSGQIAVDSKLGEGAVFAVYLRLLAKEQNDGQNPHDTGC
jgi:signal transduction histidine kinase